MSDITNLFKATIKTVKTRQKSQGIVFPVDKSMLMGKHKSEFKATSSEVVGHITKLRDFLLQHRRDYVNTSGAVLHDSGHLTDSDRDRIDTDAEKFMKVCHEAIKNFKTQAQRDKVLPQVRQHRDAVIGLIQDYLKVVCRIYSEQRAIRVKRVVDRKRIARLEPESKKAKTDDTFVSRLEKRERSGEALEAKESSTASEPCQASTSQVPGQVGYSYEDSDDDMEMSPEEQQQLAVENQQLYEEMNSVVDEVKQIEGRVVEISRLQEIFGERVLEQEKDIDRIAETVVGTTENIKDANDEIREAMKNNAGLRVWILFFLIVLSLSLLFLDWYNP